MPKLRLRLDLFVAKKARDEDRHVSRQPYAHPKYKFVVRAKLQGKWKRSYFRSEKEAIAYARKQNALAQKHPLALSDSSHSFEAPKSVSRQRSRDTLKRQSDGPATLVRNAVVILGMHRSGTSALGGA